MYHIIGVFHATIIFLSTNIRLCHNFSLWNYLAAQKVIQKESCCSHTTQPLWYSISSPVCRQQASQMGVHPSMYTTFWTWVCLLHFYNNPSVTDYNGQAKYTWTNPATFYPDRTLVLFISLPTIIQVYFLPSLHNAFVRALNCHSHLTYHLPAYNSQQSLAFPFTNLHCTILQSSHLYLTMYKNNVDYLHHQCFA